LSTIVDVLFISRGVADAELTAGVERHAQRPPDGCGSPDDHERVMNVDATIQEEVAEDVSYT
jgi:hypothetical protein